MQLFGADVDLNNFKHKRTILMCYSKRSVDSMLYRPTQTNGV